MGEIHAALFYDGRTLDRRRLDHNFEPLHEEGEQGGDSARVCRL